MSEGHAGGLDDMATEALKFSRASYIPPTLDEPDWTYWEKRGGHDKWGLNMYALEQTAKTFVWLRDEVEKIGDELRHAEIARNHLHGEILGKADKDPAPIGEDQDDGK